MGAWDAKLIDDVSRELHAAGEYWYFYSPLADKKARQNIRTRLRGIALRRGYKVEMKTDLKGGWIHMAVVSKGE